MDYSEEIKRRFALQEEYLGTDKEVNRIEPLVSITVSAYNHEAYIKDCLDGILMQKTDFPFEIIVGEDDSTDNTRAICIEYAEKYPDKIRLFLRDRKLSHLYDENGIFIRRLNGVLGFSRMSARGKYTALCEGDDFWIDPLKLQKQVDFLEKNKEYSVTVSAVKVFYEDTGQYEEKTIIPNSVRPEENGYTYHLKDTISYWVSETATVLFRNSKEFEEEYTSYTRTRDTILQYVLLKQGPGFYFFDFMAVYRKHSGGVFSGNTNFNNYKSTYICFQELYRKNKDEFTRNKYLQLCFRLFNTAMYEKEIEISTKEKYAYFFEAVRLIRKPKDILSLISAIFPSKLKSKLRGKKA